MVDIVRDGRYGVRYKTFLDNRIITSHDIELVKWNTMASGDEYCITIASYTDKQELISCGDRLLNAINSEEDLMSIKRCDRVARAILATTKVDLD